jgi:hypothetical protein
MSNRPWIYLQKVIEIARWKSESFLINFTHHFTRMIVGMFDGSAEVRILSSRCSNSKGD